MSKKLGFRITDSKGLHITFPNYVTVSVQWGTGNYCDNRDFGLTEDYFGSQHEAGARGSLNAEVAIMNPAGNFIRHPSFTDDVKGWVTPTQLLALLEWASTRYTDYPLATDVFPDLAAMSDDPANTTEFDSCYDCALCPNDTSCNEGRAGQDENPTPQKEED